MKRAIVIAAAAIILSIPSIGSAQTCSSTISLSGSIPMMINMVQTALTNYDTYLEGGHYELCFTGMTELPVNSTHFTSSFNLKTKSDETKDVYVVGLHIMNNLALPVDIPILVTNNQGSGKIILKDISLKDVRNGIQIAGNPSTKVVSSVVQGDASKSGTCVEIKADGATVQGSEISGCGEGIVIEADGALIGAADHEHVSTDKNSIHDNVIGLHVVSGKRNKFGYNVIYENKPSMAPEGLSTDAILIEPDANEGLLPLEIELFEADDGIEYALKCTKDEAGIIVKREMLFKLPQGEGMVALYKSDVVNDQMLRYLTNCDVNSDGVCVIGNLPEDVMELIPEGECGIEYYMVTALFTGTSSSALLVNSHEFDSIAVIMAPLETGPVDMPGVSDMGGDVDIEEELGGGSGSGMGGEGGAISMGGVASSGCGGGGASLANDSFRNVVLGFNAWWILFALTILGAFRLARSRK